jgi:DNA-binding NarL/FixJ family response regulator
VTGRKKVAETEHAVRVVVVAEHALARSITKRFLEIGAKCEVVGEASDGSSAIPVVAETCPHVVLIDDHFASDEDIDFLPALRNAAPDACVLLVTLVDNIDVLCRAVQMGVRGVVYKHAGADCLLKAIEKVRAGEIWLGREFTAALIDRSSGSVAVAPRRNGRCADGFEALTPREREIVRLVCAGYQNKLVASELGITDVTVRHHLTSVFAKLGVRDRVALILQTHRTGLSASRG